MSKVPQSGREGIREGKGTHNFMGQLVWNLWLYLC